MKIVGVIPARYHSTRFPGKVLATIAGKPMIQHVYENSLSANLSRLLIATDDPRVAAVAESFGAEVVMTSPEHRSGTERIAEVAKKVEADAFVNIQGDEPLIHPEIINKVVRELEQGEEMVSVFTIIKPEEAESPDVVKVILDREGYALYFSRSPIPFGAEFYLKHIGIYGYTRTCLLNFVSYPFSYLEKWERLEQLRALFNGIKIKMVETKRKLVAVDRPEDIKKVEEFLKNGN